MSQSFCKPFDYRQTPQSAGLLDNLKTIAAPKTYTAKLKTRKQMEREIPPERMGWWHDVCPGETLRNLRDATPEDLARCYLNEGSSRDPADYLCESFAHGALVSREAIAVLTPNAKVSGTASAGLPG